MDKVKNIIIPNQDKLAELKETIAKGGVEKFYVVSDFDKTLTTASINGKRVLPLIAVLRNGNYLTADYVKKARALFDKYYLIEIDPSFPLEEKKKVMHELRTTHFKLMIKSGLKRKDIEDVVKSGENQLREGIPEFVSILNGDEIPLIILSANGLGEYAIKMFLEEENALLNNVHIISNSYEWDSKGNASAVAIKEPIVHPTNKDLVAIRELPVFEKIKNRGNVLLLGDNLSDSKVVDNIEFDNLIKIGFLNDNVGSNLEEYKENYDVILLGDPSMDYVNQLVSGLIK
jgi:5'-nucleotidase